TLPDGIDGPFDLMERHPEDAEHFNRSMLELTRGVAAVLPACYDFSAARSVCDIGGGFGALLPPLLRAHPELRAVVFDLPRCADGSRELMTDEGLADRCAFQAGDFFESGPSRADVYLLKSAVHDRADRRRRPLPPRRR